MGNRKEREVIKSKLLYFASNFSEFYYQEVINSSLNYRRS